MEQTPVDNKEELSYPRAIVKQSFTDKDDVKVMSIFNNMKEYDELLRNGKLIEPDFDYFRYYLAIHTIH